MGLFEDEESFVYVMNGSTYELANETHDYEEYVAFLEKVNFVSITSIVLLTIAFMVWGLFTIKKRPASPYRIVSFMVTIISSIVALAMIHSIHYFNVFDLTIRILVCVMGAADHIVVFSLLGYNVLCVIRALKKTVTTGQILVCVLTYILIAVVCTAINSGLTYTADIHGHININHVVLLYLLTGPIPKLVSLATTLVINIVLTYWLFVLDNAQYKSSREYKVMRYSCVVMYFVIGYFTMTESVMTVAAALRQDFGYCLDIGQTLYAGQGILISVLLCFLDLEILDILPGGCIDLGEEYSQMDDETADRKLIADDIESTSSMSKVEKHHVTSFERDMTPRDTMQTGPLYGSIPKGT